MCPFSTLFTMILAEREKMRENNRELLLDTDSDGRFPRRGGGKLFLEKHRRVVGGRVRAMRKTTRRPKKSGTHDFSGLLRVRVDKNEAFGSVETSEKRCFPLKKVHFLLLSHPFASSSPLQSFSLFSVWLLLNPPLFLCTSLLRSYVQRLRTRGMSKCVSMY